MSIYENISLKWEIVHNINIKVRVENARVKVDMAKGYNILELGFIMKFLKTFGFYMQWQQVVYNWVSSS